MKNVCTILIVSLFFSGCSLIGFTPVIVGSSIGIDKKDLSNEEKYSRIINKWLIFKDSKDKSWTVKKFKKGRYYIETNSIINKGIQKVCSLDEKKVFITKVYNDKLNGGIFYEAIVKCSIDLEVKTYVNTWHDDISLFKQSTK